MEVIGQKHGDNLVIFLAGELDDHTANFTRTKLDELTSNCQYDDIIYDLTKLTFMDSTGIGVLLGRFKKLKSKHRFFIKNPSKTIDMIFQMAGLYNIMPKIG